MDKIIGYDCDGNELYEYMVIRAPFYSDIDFNVVSDVDPRQYCVIRSEVEKCYLISVWDWYEKEAIRRYEKIEGDIPVIVKDIKESEKYEIATDSSGKIIYYDLDKSKLHETLSKILNSNKKSKIEEINSEIKKQKQLKNINTKQVSDTHHTFEKLYEQRVVLFSVLCNQIPELSWKSKQHFDEEIDPMFNGDFIAGINTPKGQDTFHMKLKYWDLFKVKELDKALEYDGYSVDDVIERLLSLNEYEKDVKRLIKKY